MGFICRMSKDFRHQNSAITLYRSLVLSRLEYASIVWNPKYKVHADLIESTQRRFVRFMSHRYGLKRELQTYAQRSAHFGLPNLGIRRSYQDLVYLFKIMNGILATSLLSQIHLRIPTRSVRREMFFSLPMCNNNVSSHNPVIRMCRKYNELLSSDMGVPDIHNTSLHKFKKIVKKLLFGRSDNEDNIE